MYAWSPPVRPEALRERAQWYRDYAKVCAGDNAWALRLAEHFDAVADQHDHVPPRHHAEPAEIAA